MSDNQAVSQELLETIHELQQLPSLSEFGLAGGTNLALRYGHRISVDIDLFSPSMIRIKGLENVCDQIKNFYVERVISSQLLLFPVVKVNQAQEKDYSAVLLM